MIYIKPISDITITFTRQHPILTKKGWTPIVDHKAIIKGEYLIRVGRKIKRVIQ